jgi:hypothetical protein
LFGFKTIKCIVNLCKRCPKIPLDFSPSIEGIGGLISPARTELELNFIKTRQGKTKHYHKPSEFEITELSIKL